MTSPDSKSDPKSTPNAQAEGGGMLPALLAGAGILAVAALFIFGGDDEKDAKQVNDAAAQQASAQHKAGSPTGGVASRQADDATPNPARPKPRLNPRIAEAVITDGMAPVPNKKPEPTSWDSVDAEIAYWEQELRDANRMLEMRQQSWSYVPGQEERIRQNGTPEDLAEFQNRKQVVADNLAKAQARVDEVQAKLAKLKG
jgi:cytoskeletal protein RodZ